MKLKVIGWTSYDDNTYEAVEATNAIYNAVLDEVVKNDYLFSGYHHQEYDYCCPVLNTGKRVLFSQRGFGGLMAEAHGYNGVYDYSLFAYPVDMDPKHFRLPTQDVDADTPSQDVEKSPVVGIIIGIVVALAVAVVVIVFITKPKKK